MTRSSPLNPVKQRDRRRTACWEMQREHCVCRSREVYADFSSRAIPRLERRCIIYGEATDPEAPATAGYEGDIPSLHHPEKWPASVGLAVRKESFPPRRTGLMPVSAPRQSRGVFLYWLIALNLFAAQNRHQNWRLECRRKA